MALTGDLAGIHADPGALLRHLIRFNTTNPPGNERACIEWVKGLLGEYGIESRLYALDQDRPNLVARIRGGDESPLLLYGHVDVVTAAGQPWTRDPFAADLVDGVIWGRGSLDMKGGDAMMIAAFLRAVHEQTELPGDVILCLLSDEEAGAEFGAGFMVDQHPELFEGVRFALGEFGGYREEMFGQTYYPIQVSEKTVVRLTGRIRGPGGHGAMIHRGGIMARLGRVLTTLDQNRLPVSVTPAAAGMVEAVANGLQDPERALVLALLDPERADSALDRMGPRGDIFDCVLHDTVNVTVINGGDKFNVVPSVVELNFDARILPSSTPEKLVSDLEHLLGEDVEFDPPRAMSEPLGQPDLRLLPLLEQVLREHDPGARPMPMLMVGATDGREFRRIGIQSYGFLPMNLPPDIEIFRLIHAADERIPDECLRFGASCIFEVLTRFDQLA